MRLFKRLLTNSAFVDFCDSFEPLFNRITVSKIAFFICTVTVTALFSDSNRVVLVTGGAGYIGSHTCKALKEAGFTPVAFDSLKAGQEESVKWGPLVIGDLLDIEALDRVFDTYKPCAVLHFAALRDVGESVRDPSSYYTNNVMGSINLLNAMLKHSVYHIIFSSSCTVYGVCSEEPILETHPKSPTNAYARSKHMIETIIQDYARAYQFHYMILRYFNAAGIDKESGLKRAKHSRGFLVPRALLTVLDKENPLSLYGGDYPTRDGTCIRDYIHVKDLAQAHVLSLEYLQGGGISDDVNLGTGKGYTVLEVLQAVERVTGGKVPYEVQSRREGDMTAAVADASKSKSVLGFETTSSDLEMIIEDEWFSLKNGK